MNHGITHNQKGCMKTKRNICCPTNQDIELLAYCNSVITCLFMAFQNSTYVYPTIYNYFITSSYRQLDFILNKVVPFIKISSVKYQPLHIQLNKNNLQMLVEIKENDPSQHSEDKNSWTEIQPLLLDSKKHLILKGMHLIQYINNLQIESFYLGWC